MISVAEAERCLFASIPLGPVESLPTLSAGGRVLRTSVQAERAFPPFDRVMMDGIAVSAQAWEAGVRDFPLTGVALAGAPRIALESANHAAEVMTGAVLPIGADLVIPVERIVKEDNRVTIAADFQPPAGGFVHRAGSDATAGTELLVPGNRLDGRAMGVAVSCGASVVDVSTLPRIAVVSTGDELVELGAPLAPHQIRRSNAPALAESLRAHGYVDVTLAHFRDDERELHDGLTALFAQVDVVLLSGGVSMGSRDLVPAALAALGVETVFHRVSQRPGKPLLFGKNADTLVFGLPGNPVSTLVGLRRWVIPALQRWEGATDCPVATVPLAESVRFPPPLTYFLPVSIDTDTGTAVPRPVANSGDFAALLDSDGFVELPAEETEFPASTRVRYFPW